MNKNKEYTPLPTDNKDIVKIDWDNYEAFTPNFIGRKVIDPIKIEDIMPYINWKLTNHYFPLIFVGKNYFISKKKCQILSSEKSTA